MCKTEEYYTENEVKEMVDDMESLNEYLYGIYGAIKKKEIIKESMLICIVIDKG